MPGTVAPPAFTVEALEDLGNRHLWFAGSLVCCGMWQCAGGRAFKYAATHVGGCACMLCGARVIAGAQADSRGKLSYCSCKQGE
jgi:hypothetical protein